MQNSSVDLRRLSARDTVAGDPASSIQGINTFNLPDGAIVWCSETKCDYQLDRSSTQTGGGAVAPSAGPGRWFPVPNEAAAFMSQAAWFVDPVNGNDTNDGATALTALRTLPELDRRLSGRVFDPAILAFTVTLAAGTYPDPLVLCPNLPLTTQTLTVQGAMTVNYTGSVTGFTAWNAAGGVRAALTDAAADFSVLKLKRLRLTSGANAGAVSSFGSVAAADTCNPNSFYQPSTGSTVVPTAGDGLVVETPATIVQAVYVETSGTGLTILRDMQYLQSSSTGRFYARGASNTRMRVTGVEFQSAGGFVVIVGGALTIGGCYFTGTFGPGISANLGGVALTATSFYHDGLAQLQQGYVLGNNLMHDGDGVRDANLGVLNGCILDDIGTQAGHSFFGSVGGSSLVEVNDGSQWILSSASCRFWGALANTATVALKVFNGCGFSYVTLPTATGAVPGNDVVLAGGAAIAWAALPAVAVAPNNAFALVRQ